jgi:hypothetical protein
MTDQSATPWRTALEALGDPYTRALKWKLAQQSGKALDEIVDAQIELARMNMRLAGSDPALMSLAERARCNIADRIEGTSRQRQEIEHRGAQPVRIVLEDRAAPTTEGESKP